MAQGDTRHAHVESFTSITQNTQVVSSLLCVLLVR